MKNHLQNTASFHNSFGSSMMGYSNEEFAYSYDFNGKETDDETGLQDYGMRIYNKAYGKFLSVDPLTSSYPWYTPYQFAGNKPIRYIDLDGLEEYDVIIWLGADGVYRTRMHLINEEGPLKVNYYARKLAHTEPMDGLPGKPPCPDCAPQKKQSTDELIVSKTVGENGVTENNIWATDKMKNHTEGANSAANQSINNGVVFSDPGFNGTIVTSIQVRRTLNTIETPIIKRSTWEEKGGGTFRNATDSEINSFFNNNTLMDKALKKVNTYKNPTVYVATEEHLVALKKRNDELGLNIKIEVNPAKLTPSFTNVTSYYFAFEYEEGTTTSTTTTTTTTTTTATVTEEGVTNNTPTTRTR